MFLGYLQDSSEADPVVDAETAQEVIVEPEKVDISQGYDERPENVEEEVIQRKRKSKLILSESPSLSSVSFCLILLRFLSFNIFWVIYRILLIQKLKLVLELIPN